MLNSTDTKTLDFSYQGQPFLLYSSLNTTGLDYSYQGQPFVATPNPSLVTLNAILFGTEF